MPARFFGHTYMEAIMANSKIAKKSIVGDKVVFTWADGTVDTIDPNNYSDAVNKQANLHGYKQKLGDSYAKSGITLSQAKAEFKAVNESLLAGDWNRKGGASSGGIIVEAIARATNKPVEEILATWVTLSDERKKEITSDPRVQLAKAEIELERKQAIARKADDDDDELGDFA